MLEFDITLRLGDFRLRAAGRQTEARMGLFGASGCGKTTLLNCIAGLIRPDEGHIALDGKVLFDADARSSLSTHRREVGYVFQDARLFGHMSVLENIEYGRGRHTSAPGASELAEALDLREFLDRHPSTLSAGQRQRVAIARALAGGPRLLLLDEPLASLDEKARLGILTYLRAVWSKWGVPFVFVSHNLSEMLFLTGRSWHMRDGRIVKTTQPEGLLGSGEPELEPVKNLFEGIVEATPSHTGYAVVRSGRLSLKIPGGLLREGDGVAMALAARDIVLSVSMLEGISARNVLPATIREMRQNGRALWVIAEAGKKDFVVELTEDAGRELALCVGKEVFLVIKSHSIIATRVKGRAVQDE